MRDVLLVVADMKLRGTTLIDGRIVWSAIDFIERAAHKTHKAAVQQLRRLMTDRPGSKHWAFFKLNIAKMHMRRSNGSGYVTPGLDIDGLRYLLNLLDRDVALEFHEACQKAFERVKAGDTTLLEEVARDAAHSCPLDEMHDIQDVQDMEDMDDTHEDDGNLLSQQHMLQGVHEILANIGNENGGLTMDLSDVQVTKAKASAQIELNVQAHLAAYQVKLKEKEMALAADNNERTLGNETRKLANKTLVIENETQHIEDRAAVEARKIEQHFKDFQQNSAFELQTKQKVFAETAAFELAQKKTNKKEWGLLQLRLAEDAQMQSRTRILEQLNALESKRIENNATLIEQDKTRHALNETMMQQEKRWRAMQ
jgi:hypothetical protein